ncbi:hypothetical protein DPX16_16145 [Anabarilius grahami]|uniref:Uncharacterized protein n=1 Tax=Anabarilius grahami TaxID=495550 RepID=A0A3N0YHW9_ANAGA|nr:hypothetical protein DPX16_16145 [Anabarilius grahami]
MKRVQMKDTAISAHPSVTSRAAHVKNDTDNKWASLFKRKNQHRTLKAPTTRYGQQNDVKEQNRVLTATNEDLQRQLEEMKTVSQNLLTELELFGETAQEHAANLLEVQNTMRDLTEAHEKLQQERALFTLDVEEMERALGEAERLLME